ncbi:hypothetical protein EGR_09175 [Echinococcus granulosus]|uniref:Uncharacterized protein n=1 Tax=Echinococcus granulosus TaxID=6210 RepID=W6U6L1_ECHGR|nr:hypothetical protein EGR_09175 [Echinococcus granulosus]EUB55971.1 hypothetical protein EGR_09175 [Echinococcus granulosus]
MREKERERAFDIDVVKSTIASLAPVQVVLGTLDKWFGGIFDAAKLIHPGGSYRRPDIRMGTSGKFMYSTSTQKDGRGSKPSSYRDQSVLRWQTRFEHHTSSGCTAHSTMMKNYCLVFGLDDVTSSTLPDDEQRAGLSVTAVVMVSQQWLQILSSSVKYSGSPTNKSDVTHTTKLVMIRHWRTCCQSGGGVERPNLTILPHVNNEICSPSSSSSSNSAVVDRCYRAGLRAFQAFNNLVSQRVSKDDLRGGNVIVSFFAFAYLRMDQHSGQSNLGVHLHVYGSRTHRSYAPASLFVTLGRNKTSGEGLHVAAARMTGEVVDVFTCTEHCDCQTPGSFRRRDVSHGDEAALWDGRQNTMSFPQPTNFLLVIAALIYFCVVCVNSHTLDSSWSDSDSSDMEIGENEALVKDLVATMGNLSPDQRHAVMKFIKSVYLVGLCHLF